MLTVGGVFFDRGQKHLFDQCAFDELDFIRSGPEAFQIDIPKLTTREIMSLNAQMPASRESIVPGSMPLTDVEQMMRIYRYLPNFVTVEAP